ncbi:outer membrane receptor protein involved in Fe transport [Dyadobacter sp. BE34]|uniref:Outer membrane receptor protein involved in Fe transport n=1 Tax=Dyadobacter fermentans TaxID=94254 RepID=A0ABU1QUN2_9BACT|nr:MULTISPECIES: TonB-dependent receptor [Dyadobacter]MDR6804707.1 outer membrane receptor protein involved in Fe transport [Dyadobacter fermentans]MDR7043534.1 outer membrane receptor protein involved in Fe transport [Dyadobacter sp. BE242]MDR7197846.1 outer membrane receptor protein involved in Fe transport [Dyadobacter sp. BE34]MDR7214721.1 outer membrane receptor protein involved in Fe transport [Dyadobacter sp. BE31]MDR7262256.1 outer membrane receptor protein involved in Fe transport [Dy
MNRQFYLPRPENVFGLLSGLVFLFMVNCPVALAQSSVHGKVSDGKGEALLGVSVKVKGASQGTVTDGSGSYQLPNLAPSATLVFSFIGFLPKEVPVGSRTVIDVTLSESPANLDEVIVTGVFDKRSRMESSVAISVLPSKLIQLQAPLSAADLLRNVPGVYVNSSLGEIRNTVSSRGVNVGGNDVSNGYYYVSMQEDGLPVTNATYGNYGPDFFLRPDLTLGKLEAVRGGTASILGNNAPGGIFNYVSKTGGQAFEVQARAKFGLEGNGRNPYYRADANIGGPLARDKTLTFNVGGFWRQNHGARYPGYPMNNGGQIKANVLKRFKNGSLKLYAKHLNDHNSWFEQLPTVNFKNPHLAPGVKQTNSVLIPPVSAEYTINNTGERGTFDSRDKIHSKDLAIGANFDHNFGKGWTVENKIRYAYKTSFWNTTSIPYPFAIDNVTFYGVNSLAGKLGTYSFQDLATGTELANVTQGINFVNGAPAGLKFTVNSSSLPGDQIQKNSLTFNPLIVFDNRVKETIDQLTLTKRLSHMSFTGGLYYAHADVKRLNPNGVGSMFGLMASPRPQPTAIVYTDMQGKVYQVTNPDGITGGSGRSVATNIFDLMQNQLAGFFGHTWEMSDKLNFDWGIRFERIRVRGSNQIASATTSTDGGTDKNPLTLYDNMGGAVTSTLTYNKTVKTISYSAGLNYKFNDQLAVYARYSQGRKAPDLGIYLNVQSSVNADYLNPIAQSTQQYEVGFKAKKDRFSLFVTPFYSLLGKVPQQALGQESAELTSTYTTAVLYNKFKTIGVEIEGTYNLNKQLSVRAVATFQKSTAVDFNTWVLNGNGKADDQIQSYSGNETDYSPRQILRVSPTYTSGKVYGSIDWSYIGRRAGNVANVFYLPGFDQTNLNLGYNISRRLQIQANVNNVFNQNGIMGWSAPGGFPASLNTQGFTKAQMEGNPNAVFFTLSLPPRSYFLTATYTF